jgi:hypothetical protein
LIWDSPPSGHASTCGCRPSRHSNQRVQLNLFLKTENVQKLTFCKITRIRQMNISGLSSHSGSFRTRSAPGQARTFLRPFSKNLQQTSCFLKL